MICMNAIKMHIFNYILVLGALVALICKLEFYHNYEVLHSFPVLLCLLRLKNYLMPLEFAQ